MGHIDVWTTKPKSLFTHRHYVTKRESVRDYIMGSKSFRVLNSSVVDFAHCSDHYMIEVLFVGGAGPMGRTAVAGAVLVQIRALSRADLAQTFGSPRRGPVLQRWTPGPVAVAMSCWGPMERPPSRR